MYVGSNASPVYQASMITSWTHQTTWTSLTSVFYFEANLAWWRNKLGSGSSEDGLALCVHDQISSKLAVNRKIVQQLLNNFSTDNLEAFSNGHEKHCDKKEIYLNLILKLWCCMLCCELCDLRSFSLDGKFEPVIFKLLFGSLWGWKSSSAFMFSILGGAPLVTGGSWVGSRVPARMWPLKASNKALRGHQSFTFTPKEWSVETSKCAINKPLFPESPKENFQRGHKYFNPQWNRELKRGHQCFRFPPHTIVTEGPNRVLS